MQLDFTGLTDIAKKTPGSTQTAQNPERGNDTAPALKALQRQANQAQSEKIEKADIYREYQNNKTLTSDLQAELLKGTKNGESITALYLKAVKTISLLIHNELFYTQIAKEIEEREHV